MSNFNYCLVQTNKIYEQIQDMLDMEEISMNNPNDTSKVIYHLEKIVRNSKFISIKPVLETKELLLEDLFVNITEKVKDQDGFQGNTLMLSANTSHSFEIIYLEDLRKKQTDDKLNELATISNLDMEPIYNDCGIVKVSYETGTHVHKKITLEDICSIVVNCFYHKGVMVSEDGSMLELDFSGDKPDLTIGNRFKMATPFIIAGLQLVPYIEESQKVNPKASELTGVEIKGRVFFAVLSPMGGKKFWNMEIPTINMLLSLVKDKSKLEKIDQELDEKDKSINPFFLVKKYCI